MKRYKGQDIYNSMEKVPFLDESLSLRRTHDSSLIERCVEYLKEKRKEYGDNPVIVPWLSHRGLNIATFGYTVCSQESYQKLRKDVEEKLISGDPVPGVAYDSLMLENKLLRLSQQELTCSH